MYPHFVVKSHTANAQIVKDSLSASSKLFILSMAVVSLIAN